MQKRPLLLKSEFSIKIIQCGFSANSIQEWKMRKSLLVLFAAAAILIMACDASALVSQFLPQKGVEQAQQTIEAVAPTVAAVATSGVPTKSAVSGTQPGPTKPATVASGSSANPFG